jgi:hypothetical protein
VRALTDALLSTDLKQLSVQVMFKNDIEGKPSGLADLNVINLRQNPTFVLAETPEDVRTWVEQFQTTPPQPSLKIVLLSSASASAAARAYAISAEKRVIGPLVSLRDAMVYQSQRQALAGRPQLRAEQRWQSIGLATVLATLIILLGVVINVIRNFRRRVAR